MTLEGLQIALGVNNGEIAGINIENLQGKVSISNVFDDDRIVVSGDGSNARVLGLGYVGSTVIPYFFNMASPAATAGLVLSCQTSSIPGVRTIPSSNQGSTDSAFVKACSPKRERRYSNRLWHCQMASPICASTACGRPTAPTAFTCMASRQAIDSGHSALTAAILWLTNKMVLHNRRSRTSC